MYDLTYYKTISLNVFIVLYHFVDQLVLMHHMLLSFNLVFRVNSKDEFTLLFYHNLQVNFQTH
jgi:hypothetical protein